MNIEIKECGCLVDEFCDPDFNAWAGRPLDTVYVQTRLCPEHKGTFELTEPTEGFAI